MTARAVSDDPGILWTPPPDVRETTEIGRYLVWLERERGLEFEDYDTLWRWSVDDLPGFWSSIWEFFEVKAHEPYSTVLASDAMPAAVWFPGARLNFAEHLVGSSDEDAQKVAIVSHSQTRLPLTLTFSDLRDQVARARTGLARLGVGPGDLVAAYMPNIPETVVAFAATASLGAVWATCAPELGARSVVDRLAQLEPTVLLAVDGYGFRDRAVDRREELATIRAALPTLRHVVHVPYGGHAVPGALSWEDLLADRGPVAFAPVAFDHPLFVLFSSGTTGPPKAIVHGHGGILLEYFKAHALSWDLKPGGRLLWFTTTSWMMWNALVSALLVRSSIVMLDGDPAWPDAGWQWRLAEETRPTFMGASPAFLMACRKAGLAPGRDYDLSSIRVFGSAGSPLPAEGYRYVYDQLGPDVLLINGSGGTDVCSGIVGGSPLLPVFEGEISGRLLGVAADAFDPHGEPLVGELGELVITRPMPSMPVGLWGDRDGSLYRSAYFGMFPGVWRQGDWIRFSERGSCAVTGRSDATLNRGGVRLGTGEFYGVVEELPEITDSLVVHLEDDDGGPGELVLFVVLADGIVLDDELRRDIGATLRSQLSPRHVPDTIRDVPAIPRTLTGKKLEAPVKRILRGEPVDVVASRDSLLDPTALDLFATMAVLEPADATAIVAESARLTLEDAVAIDVHAHVETSKAGGDSLPDELREAAIRHFRGQAARPTVDELASFYRERRMMAVVFTVDSESFTGQARVPNEEIAEAALANADVLIPFASIDPHKGRRGVDEARRLIADYGVRGFKFHPNVQAFFPNDRLAYPLYEVIEEAGLPALFHTGQSGVGSGLPGGGGIRLKFSNPIHVDDVAADFPTLKIVLAHPSFPWQDEAISIALHKPQVYIDLSGWSPKYFPPQLVHHANTLLRDRVLFGTDYPFITPERWLADFDTLEIRPEVRPLILKQNAMRLLGLG